MFKIWEDEDDFPFINTDHKAYQALMQIDQEGFSLEIIAYAKDLKCLSRVLKNLKNPYNL